ncbi:type II secretion system protein N [Rubrivivax rivuli]|uniref:Type II secretion system protein N n=1 Tax=Rubrivivax rivuli TaxID=1862385 RepID=A0A437RKU7_9BURK|nr:type II secretion system protein N [Rubrivivax rivuli]RVU47397.1 general secretion pathway protein GspN [Rubrivivax rivuli]
MKRWAVAGAATGVLVALVAFAPAAWLAGALASATGQRLLLADARGTVWNGNAVLILTGGEGSRDASALPDRLHWRLRPTGAGFTLHASQPCCINGEQPLRVAFGLGRVRLELPAAGADAGTGLAAGPGPAFGQWPAAWLTGLGTPWNTLRPTGTLQLSSPGLVLEQVQGRWRFTGRLDLTLATLASRLSTLDSLGSYRLTLSGDAAGEQPARLQLLTTEGALQLSGSGELLGSGAASRLRFRGQASAAGGYEAALGNLLNIIGRRQGASSIISIG